MSDLSHLEGFDPEVLAALEGAGIGEGDFEEGCPSVPPELTDLHIELEEQGKTPAELAEWALAEEEER